MPLRIIRIVLFVVLAPILMPLSLIRALFFKKRLPQLGQADSDGRVVPFDDFPVALNLTDWTPMPTRAGAPLRFERTGEGVLQLSRKLLSTAPTKQLEDFLAQTTIESILKKLDGPVEAFEKHVIASGLTVHSGHGQRSGRSAWVANVAHETGFLTVSWSGTEAEAAGRERAQRLVDEAAVQVIEPHQVLASAPPRPLEEMFGGEHLESFAQLQLVSTEELKRFPGACSRPFNADLHLLFVASMSANSSLKMPVTVDHLARAGLTQEAFFQAAQKRFNADDLKIERDGQLLCNTQFRTSMACFTNTEVLQRVEAELGPRWVVGFPGLSRFVAAVDSPEGRAAVEAYMQTATSVVFDQPSPAIYRVRSEGWTRVE